MDNSNNNQQGLGSGVVIDNTQIQAVGGLESLIVLKNTYSEDGGWTSRHEGTYALGNGGAEDKLRDALGKCWVPIAHSTEVNDITFLNSNYSGPQSNLVHPPASGARGGTAKLPFKFFADDPVLVNDSVWPEYIQDVYIDIDEFWFHTNIIKPVFDTAGANYLDAMNMVINNIVADGNGMPTNVVEETEAAFQEEKNKIITWLFNWWQFVMSMDGADESVVNQIEDIIPNFTLPLVQVFNPYSDYNFKINKPVIKTFNDKMNSSIKTPFAYVEPNYNFYIDSYEQQLDLGDGNKLDEKILPNIYAHISSFVGEASESGIPQISEKYLPTT